MKLGKYRALFGRKLMFIEVTKVHADGSYSYKYKKLSSEAYCYGIAREGDMKLKKIRESGK